jgi:radical SAM protein with 4Fe4S-binding SPASM domain
MISDITKGISIVISVYRQEKELNLLLEQIILNSSNYDGNYEIIIVADGNHFNLSTTINSDKIKYFYREKNLGSGLSRHFGVLKSRYDIICFIDADTELKCDLLDIIDKNFKLSPELSGIIGVVDKQPINDSLTAKFLSGETNYYGKECKKLIHNFFIAQCGAIKKKVYFENLGFYHRDIDDMEFSSRLKDNFLIKTVKDLNYKHAYSSFLIAYKKFFRRSYHFAMLDKKPFSPWFTKLRKISTLSVGSTILFSFLLFFSNYFLPFLALSIIVFLFTCKEIFQFKNNFKEIVPFTFLKFCLQLAIGSGLALGFIKVFTKNFFHYLIYNSGPFRIYLRYNKPTYLILYVTGRCNSKCSYCFQWDILNVGSRVKNELTLEDYNAFAKKLGPLEHITLGGGEPTLRNDLADIAIAFYKHTKVRNISMPTNGIRPDLLEKHVEKILEECPKLTLKVSLSIDGVSNEHDKLRGVVGNYERLIESDKVLRLLRKKYKNLYYIVNTCYLAQNEKTILDTIKKNQETFDLDIQVSTFVRGSLADEKSKDVDINKYFEMVDYLENIQTIEKKSNNYGLELLHQGLQIESRSSIKNIMEKGEGKYNCSAGKNMLVMDELGNINPCEILPSKFGYGNIKNYNMDITEMYKDYKIKNIQKRIKDEKCFCTWECAQLNSTVYSFKGIFNMFKQSYKVLKRRKKLLKLGNISFEDYKKKFIKESKAILDYDKYVHPMVKEGIQLNPFNIKKELNEKNEIGSKVGMESDELEKKKIQWLKPVKAGSIPETYKHVDKR